MDVYLIRHGETVYNKLKKYQGQQEIPLSPEGREALRPAGFVPDQVYVSPLGRARETAEILFPGVKQIPVPGIMEMCFGKFEGQSYEDMEHDPVYVDWISRDAKGRCPGGESKTEFTQRVVQAMQQLVEIGLKTPEKPLVIVAHGGTQMAAMEAMGRPAEDYYSWCAPNGCGYRLTEDPEKWAAGEHILTLAEKICCTKQAHTW